MSIQIIDKHRAKLVVSVGGRNTRKRKTKIVEYSGKKDLDRKYQDFKREVEDLNCEDLSVEEIVRSFIKNRELLGVKATTIRGYNIAIKRIISAFNKTSATSVTTYHIEKFIAEMQNNDYSPKTIKNTISLLNAAYSRGIKTGILKTNPCENATLPKQVKNEIKTLTRDEVSMLLMALDKESLDLKVGYELCLLCGLRRSEVLGLTEDDVNLVFKTISINKTRHLVDGKASIQDTKTERSHRVIAIPDSLARDIERLINMHHSFEYSQSKFLILDSFGKEMNPSSFTNSLYRIERNNGIQRVSVHGLRHTFASMLNANGIDIARISQELGHSNIGTTLNVYTHVFGNASASSRGIADMIEESLGNCGTLVALEEKKKA